MAHTWTPDLILAPSCRDAHQDHRTIGEVLPTVFRDQLSLSYEIPKWDGDLGRPSMYVPLTADVAHRKIELLHKCFPSQASRDWWDDEVFLGLARLRGMECRAPYSEAFISTKIVLQLVTPSSHTVCTREPVRAHLREKRWKHDRIRRPRRTGSAPATGHLRRRLGDSHESVLSRGIWSITRGSSSTIFSGPTTPSVPMSTSTRPQMAQPARLVEASLHPCSQVQRAGLQRDPRSRLPRTKGLTTMSRSLARPFPWVT